MMWVIIDGNNWYSRAWFALKPIKSQDPAVVQADLEDRCIRSVQTVERWVEDAAHQLKPTMLAICWDSPSNSRRDQYPEYKPKAERPPGYAEAMVILRRELQDYRQCESTGYEADDLMAGFARDAIDEGERCLLCSSDKDLHQCLTAGFVAQCTRMSRPVGGDRLRFHVTKADELMELYGVTPLQWVDFRCLSGDPSDKLPGAPGIGPKTAREILAACGTLDGFYKEPFKAPITATKRNVLLEFKAKVPMMRDLVTLRPDAILNLEVPV